MAGVVHDVAQAQDAAHAARASRAPGSSATSPRRPKRLLIDEKEVGLEDRGGMVDDRAAHLQRLLNVDMQLQGRVVAVAQLDHARYADEIDATA